MGYQLRRASQAMLDDLVNSTADLGIRPTNASILLLVAANPGITQSRIGQILGVERANMAPMTAQLTALGLLIRVQADGRSHGLSLNEQGMRLANTLRERIALHEAKFSTHLSVTERTALLARLEALWK